MNFLSNFGNGAFPWNKERERPSKISWFLWHHDSRWLTGVKRALNQTHSDRSIVCTVLYKCTCIRSPTKAIGSFAIYRHYIYDQLEENGVENKNKERKIRRLDFTDNVLERERRAGTDGRGSVYAKRNWSEGWWMQ